jgi:hypothetical protein
MDIKWGLNGSYLVQSMHEQSVSFQQFHDLSGSVRGEEFPAQDFKPKTYVRQSPQQYIPNYSLP